MANQPKDVKAGDDDPRQAIEEGDPTVSGRPGRRVEDEPDAHGANRTDPDASRQQGKKDASATTPHWESGDR